MAAIDDPRSALPAGYVLTRDSEAELVEAYIALGRPLLAADGVAAVGAPLAYPASLPRMPDERRYGADWDTLP